jgi:hypothetical protein
MAVGRPTYLFIVCSAHPRVGKTLAARLVVEFEHANGRPVAAFDLGTGAPALAEFLPDFTAPAAIEEINGQMALFERLASDDGAPKVVDVGHRALAPLFMIMRDVNFATLAAQRGIQPIVLYVAAPTELSARGYAILREQFPTFGFVPVENAYATRGESIEEVFPTSLVGAPSLQLPELSPALRVLVEHRPCSFAELYRSGQQELSPDLWAEFDDWLRQCFRQLRDLDLALQMNDPGPSSGES